jgi:hypothetical protein
MIKIAIFFSGAMLACALTAGAVTQAPLTKAVSGVVSGVAAQDLNGADLGTDGQCNVTAWVDQCPSGVSTCTCLTIASPKAGGALASDGGTISDLFITIENAINPASEPPPNGIGPIPVCNGFLGVFTLTDKTGQTETFNFAGSSCKHVIGISSKNQSGTHDKDILLGGWGVSNDPAPSPHDGSGWGEFTGTVLQSTQLMSLKLNGDITK